MVKYGSKINWWLPVITGLVLILCAILSIQDDLWLAPAVILPVITLLVYSYTLTSYIDNNILFIKAGFYRKQIPVTSIRKITETTSIMTAPALSYKRIEVFYDSYNSVEISPKEQDNFVTHLQSINPAIAYRPKVVK